MSDIAIRVDNLGKQYHIGQRERYHSLRDSLARTLSAPARWLGSAFSSKHKTSHSDGQDADTFWALKDVSFEVKRGEVVGVIGRNGAGKSTLLKILSRITEPTTGQIEIRGRVGSLLEVGTGFHPELTGRENIYLNGAILGMKRVEITRKFDEIVEFSEIEKFLDTPVKHYSSGMYMRLAFAVAAHLEPEILIVDEVLAVGDAQFQKKCLGKMDEVAGSGRTVFFVSHNMAAVQSLCEKVIRLQGGLLRGFGTTNREIEVYLEDIHSYMVTEGPRRLNEEIELCGLTSSPRKVESGQRIRFIIALRAFNTLTFDHLCLLLDSSLDIRVAIVDLRRDEGPYRVSKGQVLTIEAQVDCLNVVEEHYRLGLFIQTATTRAEFLNLAEVEVLPRGLTGSIVPYHGRYRGFIEFTHWICDVRVD